MTPTDLCRAARAASAPADPDPDLLARFAAARDEDAFAELVRRHGPMVLAVCRRVAGHPDDAEDAFQAAFLVLARRADRVRLRGAVGAWLFGVARRTALAARRAAARRRAADARATPPDPVPPPGDDAELRAVLDEELARLPDRYRAVLILADLEQLDRRRVAAELGIPEGTVASRQARARALLAGRLARRGWGLPAALAAAAPALVPSSLAARVPGDPGRVPEALARQVLATMTTKKLAVSVALAAAVGGGLVGLVAAGPGAGDRSAGSPGYAVTAAGGSALLLDPASGNTWVLRDAGGEPTWVPVKRAAADRPAPPPAAAPAPLPPAKAPPAVEAVGRLVPARSARVHAAAAGVMTTLAVKEGQAVKAGELLATLDDADARLGVAAAQVELNLAKDRLALTSESVKRGNESTIELRKVEAEVKRQEVAVERAQARLGATRVLSPFAGVVVKVTAQPGEAVGPGGPAVAEVATLGELVAVADVAEGDLGRVAVGQACTVTVRAADAAYPGVVERVGAVIDPATATAPVRVKVVTPKDHPAPRPGSFVTVRFEHGKK
jgi:RND family efflux transporter MFP subunit